MGNLSAIISADTTGFKKSVEEAKNILEKFSKAEDDAVKQIKEVSNVSDSQVAAFQRVNRTLSKVSSGAMSTAQSEKALSSQVKELRIQYANLSDTAKQSDFGKAIQRSCEDATKYLNQVRQQLDAVKEKTEETSQTNTSFGNVLGNLKGILGSVGLALGAATTAQAAFEKAINSNQTTADGFAGVMEAAKTSVNQFFYAITTGDFSVFNNGLNNLITRAREAAAAIDQLGNTLMSYGVINAKAQSKITAAKAILYDPDATEEQKKKAEADIRAAYKEISDAAEVAVGDYAETITKAVEAEGNISLGGEGAIDIIDKWLEMDATKGRKEAKRIADEQYKAYQEELKALRQSTGQDVSSTDLYRGQYSGNYGNRRDDAAYAKGLEKLNDKYKDAIVAHTLITKYQDDQLDNLGKQRIAMIQMSDSAAEYAIQMGKVGKALNGGNKGGGGGNKSTTNQRIPLDLSLEPISIGKTEREIEDAIKDINEKIKNTPSDALKVLLLAEKSKLERELDDLKKNPIKVKVKLEADASNLDLSGVQNADTSNITKNPIYKKDVWNKGVDGAYEMVGALDSVYSAIHNIDKGWNEMSDWEHFFAITDLIFGVADAINSVISGYQSLMEVMHTLSAISTAASQRKIQENQQESSSNISKMATEQGLAITEATESGAKLPFPYNLAAIAAGVAAVLGAIAVIGSFAEGGIIKGSNTIGDMNIARVNSGEMILNGSQQKHLFNMLNQGGGNTESSTSGEVHFKIQGKDLVGVLSNYNKKVGKVL